MSIICLEGASAVGKTTVCKLLEKEHGYIRVAEVNELFKRSSNEPIDWYFKRQLERWKMANDISKNGDVALLDGDPFQPVWYNWIYSNEGLQPINEVIKFYLNSVINCEIEFPDKYILLTTTESELCNRKELDTIRSRRNFGKHLKLVDPQVQYFKTMKNSSPRTVEFIVSNSPECVAKKIVDTIGQKQDLNSFELLRVMSQFVKNET